MLDGKGGVFPQGLMVSAVSVENASPRAPCSNEKLKSLGFDGFVRDLLTGPEAVLTMTVSYTHLTLPTTERV